MALFILSPQIINHNVVIGVDGMFHMNRFYDAAMQIKQHNFSYFQMNYSFDQCARIVNALYGPFFSYLAGALLLVAGSWLRFQLLGNLLLLVLAGTGSYFLARNVNANKRWATVAGLMYMAGGAVPSWLTTSQFTGWGAALLPFALAAGVRMLDPDKQLRVLPLAIAMAALMETHMLTAVLAAAALTMMAIWALVIRKDRGVLLLRIVLAAVICLLMTANVWGGMLEVYGGNHLVAPFAPIASSYDATTISFAEYGVGAAAALGLVFSLVLIGQIAFALTNRDRSRQNLAVTIIGAIFILLSSNVFPWTKAIAHWPVLASYLQFPSRLRPVAVALLVAAAAASVTVVLERQHRQPVAATAIASVAVALLALQTVGAVQGKGDTWQRPQVIDDPTGVVFNAADMGQVKNSLAGGDLAQPLSVIQKVSADYLPQPAAAAAARQKNSALKAYGTVTAPITPLQKDSTGGSIDKNAANAQVTQASGKSADQEYRSEVVLKKGFSKRVLSGGRLQVTWTAKQAGNVRLPVAAYAHTQVLLNGKQMTRHKLLASRSDIGMIKVRARKGRNRVVVSYQSGSLFKILLPLSIIVWLIVLVGQGAIALQRRRIA
jgi:hypothetical protein